jgi:hypothetical protein
MSQFHLTILALRGRLTAVALLGTRGKCHTAVTPSALPYLATALMALASHGK